MFEWLNGLIAHNFIVNAESEATSESDITLLAKASYLVHASKKTTEEKFLDEDEKDTIENDTEKNVKDEIVIQKKAEMF